MQSEFSSFLENPEHNIYEFILRSIENSDHDFTVDDFHFSIKKHDTSYEFETSDEFLLELNSSMIKTSSDPLELIQRISDAYGDLFGEKSPLYNNQDIFELENDNHDIKFIARMRFTEDDIHGDVFSKVFDFLPRSDLLSIRRVNKKFNHLATLGTIWKKFCSEIVEDGDYFTNYITVEIFPKVSWVSTSDRTIVDKKFKVKSSIRFENCAELFYTTTVSSGVHDLDVHLKEETRHRPQDQDDEEEEYDDGEDFQKIVAVGVFGNDMDWSEWKNDGQGQCICENTSLPLNYLWYWQSTYGDFTRYS
jgi:hypothetical protein